MGSKWYEMSKRQMDLMFSWFFKDEIKKKKAPSQIRDLIANANKSHINKVVSGMWENFLARKWFGNYSEIEMDGVNIEDTLEDAYFKKVLAVASRFTSVSEVGMDKRIRFLYLKEMVTKGINGAEFSFGLKKNTLMNVSPAIRNELGLKNAPNIAYNLAKYIIGLRKLPFNKRSIKEFVNIAHCVRAAIIMFAEIHLRGNNPRTRDEISKLLLEHKLNVSKKTRIVMSKIKRRQKISTIKEKIGQKKHDRIYKEVYSIYSNHILHHWMPEIIEEPDIGGADWNQDKKKIMLDAILKYHPEITNELAKDNKRQRNKKILFLSEIIAEAEHAATEAIALKKKAFRDMSAVIQDMFNIKQEESDRIADAIARAMAVMYGVKFDGVLMKNTNTFNFLDIIKSINTTFSLIKQAKDAQEKLDLPLEKAGSKS